MTAVCTVAIGSTGALAAETGQRYFLGVGVENYRHRKLREPEPLKYPVEDVTELGALLKASGYRVRLLTDASAQGDESLAPTKANIERELAAMRKKCTEADTVVLALAGHGLQFAGQKEAYFCPLDAVPFADETGTLVSISSVYEQLDRSFAGVKVILVDACRNDPDPSRGRGLDADSAPPPPKGVAALFSCSAGQKAFENDVLRHGAFFHYVLAGLGGEAPRNSRNQITFYGLSEYVCDHVPGRVSELIPGRVQLPNSKADLAGTPPVLVALRPSAPSKPERMPARPTPTPPKPSTPSNLAEAGSKPGELRMFNEELNLRMAWCPPGKFKMGSPASEPNRSADESQVDVELTRGFWLGETEVTQAQWHAVLGTSPWQGKNYSISGADVAATYVSWDDAQEFCRRFTERERRAGRLPREAEYRLPTEAQWEYACRAGKTTRFSFGNYDSRLNDHAWWGGFFGNGNAKPEQYAHPVGRKKPNPRNLRDIHGNVLEWCQDGYHDRLPGGRDPVVDTPRARVLRGGSWVDGPVLCRSAYRSRSTPAYQYYNTGFRLARTIP